MTGFEVFKNYLINNIDENDIISRQELISWLKKIKPEYGINTLDKTRRWFTSAGYLEDTDKSGFYRLVIKPDYTLTSNQLEKEAYPNRFKK